MACCLTPVEFCFIHLPFYMKRSKYQFIKWVWKLRIYHYCHISQKLMANGFRENFIMFSPHRISPTEQCPAMTATRENNCSGVPYGNMTHGSLVSARYNSSPAHSGAVYTFIQILTYGFSHLLPLVPDICLSGSELLQIMACGIFGANPLPQPMLAHFHLDP